MSRIDTLQRALQERGLKAGLIVQPRNVFYLAGSAFPANLWVPADRPPILFTRRVHELAAASVAGRLEAAPAAGFGEMRRILADRGLLPGQGERVGIEADVMPAALMERLRGALPGVEIEDLGDLVVRQRAVKEPGEVAAIERAASVWDAGHRAVLETLRPGVTELEVSAAVEHALRVHGGMGRVWFRRWDADLPGGGIVAGGPRGWAVSGHAMTVTGVGLSPALPWGASREALGRGDLVVVDFGVCVDGYHADMCRTYSIGQPSPAQRDLWRRLLELHEAAMAAVRPGAAACDAYRSALDLARRMGLERHFMGVAPYTGAYIGHGIGVELDEAPLLAEGNTTPLEPGMVVTVEPKLMVPGIGGVMVEDDLLVTHRGCRRLSTVPDELFVV